MRKITVIGNWKMHTTLSEASRLLEGIVSAVGQSAVRVAVAPPFTALHMAGQALSASPIILAAQNMSDSPLGAHTGEIAATQLTDLNVEMVILGHSERRHVYGEDDAFINRKVLLALQESLIPILCVGETLDQREADQASEICRQQLQAGLQHVSLEQAAQLIIAYEPVWAIGTGRTATPQDANDMHGVLRQSLATLYDNECADNCTILYGGSVKPENSHALISEVEIDGALVGGASLAHDSFLAIIRSAP